MTIYDSSNQCQNYVCYKTVCILKCHPLFITHYIRLSFTIILDYHGQVMHNQEMFLNMAFYNNNFVKVVSFGGCHSLSTSNLEFMSTITIKLCNHTVHLDSGQSNKFSLDHVVQGHILQGNGLNGIQIIQRMYLCYLYFMSFLCILLELPQTVIHLVDKIFTKVAYYCWFFGSILLQFTFAIYICNKLSYFLIFLSFNDRMTTQVTTSSC